MPTKRTPFVGRAAELGVLRARLDAATAGRPQVVLVDGPAGIGKTALVRRFLGEHPELQMVWVSGDEPESVLAFGLLGQLDRVRGTGGRLDGGAERADPLAAGAELLEWVANAASEGPLVLVLDDAQWADGPSLGALAFMLRRLVAEPALVVLVCRDGELAALPPGLQRILGAEGVTRVSLSGLAVDELVTLASELGRPPLERRAAERLRTHTGGNPLHARALLDELDSDVLSDPDPRPLPAPASFATLVLARLAQCSPAAQALLTAASVHGLRWRVDDAARLAGVDDPLAPLDELVGTGFVETGPTLDQARFSHLLVQAAVYHDLAPGRRASLHRRAAELAGSVEESLRHRAAASLGHDPGLAAELAALAGEQAGRGAWGPAASGFLAAARLDEGTAAQRWLLSGVECLVQSGDAPGALARRPFVEGCAPSAQREYVRGFLAIVSGDRDGGKRLLEQAWAQAGGADDEVAAKLASHLAMVALNEGRGHDAVEFARRASVLSTRPADLGVARAVEALGLGEIGRFEEGIAAMGAPPDDLGSFDCEQVGALLGRGVLRLWHDDLELARRDLTAAEAAARRVAPLYMRLIALFYLADAEYRFGRWDEASTHAELATSLGQDASEVWTLGLSHSVAALPAAGRGEWARAEAHVAAAEEAAAALGDPANRFWVAVARARLAQAHGDHGGVLAATDVVVGLDLPDGREEPGIQPWALLRAEALVAAGRRADAVDLLDQLATWAQRRGHPSTEVGIARLKGRLARRAGALDEAAARFDEALVLAAGHEVATLEHALATLDAGRLARERGRHELAVEHLQAARTMLHRLAAAPFLASCEAELAACGVGGASPADPFRSQLSPQEQAVATLVAGGLTNRQAAAQLIVSTKAVEYHLTNIFAKLGLRNRVELAALLASATDGGATPAR